MQYGDEPLRDISATVRALLNAYLVELYEWNVRVNLTRVPQDEAWGRHIEESLALLDHAQPPDTGLVADIGSGGGIPGMPWAIVRPQLRMVLIEADQRKASVLTHISGKLGLRNVEVVAKRAEEVGQDPQFREQFDLAISRATAPPAVLCELALPLLTVGGHLIAHVGHDVTSEECVVAADECGGDVPVVADGYLTIAKAHTTPSQYPRRVGLPLRKPLS